MSCLEEDFSRIGTIEAFGLTDLVPSFNTYMPKKFLSDGDVRPSDDNVVPKAVPLYPGSAKLSESTVRGRGGDGYEVSLTWQVHRPSAADLAVLEDMKRGAKHLRITAFHNAVAYILAEADHYQMDYEQSGQYIECSVKVCSVNGIQRVAAE